MKGKTLYLSAVYLNLAQKLVDRELFRSKSDLIRSALIRQLESDIALNQGQNMKLKITTIKIPEEFESLVEELNTSSSFSEYTRLAMKNMIDSYSDEISPEPHKNGELGSNSKIRGNEAATNNRDKSLPTSAKIIRNYATEPYPKMKIGKFQKNGDMGYCEIQYLE